MKKRWVVTLALAAAIATQMPVMVSAAEEGTNVLESVIENDETGIPDSNLYQAVLKAADTNGDNVLTTTEAEALGSLEASYRGIEELTGLDNCTSLVYLYLSGNEISSIEALSGLTNLRHLELSGNKISSIEALSGLTGLNTLYLSGNEISSIKDLSVLTNLENLDLSGNKISSIEALSKLEKLRILNLSDTGISSIGDLSVLTNLENLDLSGNKISSIEVLSDLENLKDLNLSYTGISDIEVLSDLDNLESLILSGNENISIEALSSLTNLWFLDLSDTGISSIEALSKLEKLRVLNLSGNENISIADLSKLKTLEELNLSRIGISSIEALSSLTNLWSLDLSYTGISDIEVLSDLDNLERLILSGNEISSIKALSNLTNLFHLDLSNNKITSVDELISLPNLGYLNLTGNEFTDATALNTLRESVVEVLVDELDEKTITAIKNDKAGITDSKLYQAVLKAADSNQNGILTVAEAEAVTKLQASSAVISDLQGLQFCRNLETLDVSKNLITDITILGELTKLNTVDVSYNKLKDASILAKLNLSSAKTEGNMTLSASKTKLSYTVEEELALNDLTVTAVYADGTEEKVTAYSTNVDKLDMSTAGTKELLITYEAKGLSAETSLTIQVDKKEDNSGSSSGSTEPEDNSSFESGEAEKENNSGSSAESGEAEEENNSGNSTGSTEPEDSGSSVEPDFGWYEEDGVMYWYEDGIRQGTEGRGKEIYDPQTDAWYWLDAVDGGKMAVGKDVYQESNGGKWVRYDETGKMIKGEDYRYDGWYYFDPITGAMAKGPTVLLDGRKVYYDVVTGQMLKGEHTINGQKYVFDEGDGHLISGSDDCIWIEIDGKQYWYEGWVRQGYDPLNENYRGKEIYDPASDAWYWLDNVQQGAMAVSKDVYQESYAGDWGEYEGADGLRYGKWVRYDADGHMVKGWHTNEDGTYYFDLITGTMAKGSVTIEGNSYYFDEVTGILQ